MRAAVSRDCSDVGKEIVPGHLPPILSINKQRLFGARVLISYFYPQDKQHGRSSPGDMVGTS